MRAVAGMKILGRFVPILAAIFALSGQALADRVDPWLGNWHNAAPRKGDLARIEIASPAYVSAKAHGWGHPDIDWGTDGAVLMGADLVATYETGTHYIEVKLHPPVDGQMTYDLRANLKTTMLTDIKLNGTLERD